MLGHKLIRTCNNGTSKKQSSWCKADKNESADIDNLFQLITSDWVSDFESEKRRETIFNKVRWVESQVKVTKSQAPCTVALRKRLGSELHGDWLCLLDDIHASCFAGMRL